MRGHVWIPSALALAVACTTKTEPVCDDTQNVFVPDDVRPDAACEVLLTHSNRSLRIEMAAPTGCDAGAVCEVGCSSPDLALSFAFCDRAPKGGTFGFAFTPRAKTDIQAWFGAARGDVASVTVTCGGDVVWSGSMGLCLVAM